MSADHRHQIDILLHDRCACGMSLDEIVRADDRRRADRRERARLIRERWAAWHEADRRGVP